MNFLKKKLSANEGLPPGADGENKDNKNGDAQADEGILPFAKKASMHAAAKRAEGASAYTSVTTRMTRVGDQLGDISQAVASSGGNELQAPEKPFQMRNSQQTFADKNQTVIVYDWDDTLSPTTWIRQDAKLHWRLPLDKQMKFSQQELHYIKTALARLECEVERLLKLSVQRAHVIIVTLARSPWVELSCKNFTPRIGQVIKQHKIKVVYAQEMGAASKAKDYDKQQFQSNEEAEKFWTGKKQEAIQQEIAKFYSQYQGQSWKNIISIGDSDFERQATKDAMNKYGAETVGTDGAAPEKQEDDDMVRSGTVAGHYRRLRTKTIKMLDGPSVDDLTTELAMLYKWLPFLVERDGGFDVDLEDDDSLFEAHKRLTGEDLS